MRGFKSHRPNLGKIMHVHHFIGLDTGGLHLRVEENGSTSSFDCGPVVKCTPTDCTQLYCFGCKEEIPYSSGLAETFAIDI